MNKNKHLISFRLRNFTGNFCSGNKKIHFLKNCADCEICRKIFEAQKAKFVNMEHVYCVLDKKNPTNTHSKYVTRFFSNCTKDVQYYVTHRTYCYICKYYERNITTTSTGF